MARPRLTLSLDDLRTTFGLGVAGNFAGHLEQAGEAADFVGVGPAGVEAPKGIFPWWVPGDDTFLGAFPLGHDRLAMPRLDGGANLQIEPEVGVLFDVGYAADGAVVRLAPRALGAFDDCSIRRPNARKISEKKNWGADSKGVAASLFAVDDLAPDGPTATFRLASFLRRDGVAHPYGVDSPLPGYSYYGAQLQDWIVDRLNHQHGAPDSPLEDVGALLARAGRPATVLVGIGATRYTPYGETTFLAVGDEAIVVVYDGAAHTPDAVAQAATDGTLAELADASVLRQTVVDVG
jgi:hypothetical protein